jgi:predicted ATPase/DNA-binding XRE family transcriptional regulator
VLQDRGKPTFGDLLRRHRRAAGLSQGALAERAQMSTEGISALERGYRRNPQRETLTLLAGALALDETQRRLFEEAATRPNYSRGGASVTVGPWKTADASNLPVVLSRFIGREADLREIDRMVRNYRLVTITGPAGVGKTQMALRMARSLSDVEGAVRFVALSSIRDGSLVASTVAAAIGIQEAATRRLIETITAYLKNKELLIVLDNCEHVVGDVASVVEELLTGCARLRILVTSREPLMTPGERRYRVPAMNEPDAVELFEDRAQAVDARFKLCDENRADVAEVCQRLDAIPLAIELAAARIGVLPLRELRKKLDDRFEILVGSTRSTVPRQRTMRAAIDWSYELLSEREWRVFECLSIFAGGASLATATMVCTGDGGIEAAEMFDTLSSLVDKSLVIVELGWDETRYSLLHSFEQYGREKLIARAKLQSIARRHAFAMLELAQRGGAQRAHRYKSVQQTWIAEQNNFRAAITWALIEGGDMLLGQRLAAELCYWEYFPVRERRAWMDAALTPESIPAEVLAGLHKANAVVCFHLREYESSVENCEHALTYYHAVNDLTGIAQTENARGHALENLRRFDEARATFEAAMPIARACESPTALAGILSGLALLTDDIETVRRYAAEARRIHERSENGIGVAFSLLNLGVSEGRAGNIDLELMYQEQALEAALELPAFARGNVMALALHNISDTLITLGRYDDAARRVRETIELAVEYGLDYYVATGLDHFIFIESQRQEQIGAQFGPWVVHAARVLGFVDAFLASARVERYEDSKPRYEALIATLNDALGAEPSARLMSEGAALSQQEALAEISLT